MTFYVGANAASRSPYSAVVHVQATWNDGTTITGSGVMVGPNDVLTASHIIYDVNHGGVATSVVVSPGRDGGSLPYGSHSTSRINYFPVDLNGDGFLTRQESQYDFAVLGLSTRVGDQTGWFGIDPTAGRGTYHVTGYPGVYADASGPRMTDDLGTATPSSVAYLFNFSSNIEVNPGNSGGPVWYSTATGPNVVGVVSTTGWAGDVYAQYNTLVGWIEGNDVLLTGGAGGGGGANDPSAGAAGISGTSGDDNLSGTSGSDLLFGLNGNDTVFGLDGADVIYGNRGLDALYGGDGNDTIFGGQNSGAETGSPAAQRSGTETIFGGNGDDLLYGNHGADILFGEAGSDTLLGGQDDDFLYGGTGADSLMGNLGRDNLLGGEGNDTLNGGGGGDSFVFQSGFGDDVIVDRVTYSTSSLNRDLIFIESNINGTGITTGSQVLSHITNNSLGQAVIDLGAGDSITITSHSRSYFISSDFIIF
jgi:V8-like Glu-specific endopeptidase